MPVRRPLARRAGIAVLLSAHATLAAPTKDECINANEAAQTSRATGKLRDAEAKLVLCTAASCPGPVRDDCAERLNEVQKALPTIVFDVRDAAGAPVNGASVAMDGAPLTTKLDGTAVPVDPGKHTFSIAAEGFTPVGEEVLVLEGDKARLARIVLPSRPVPAAAPLVESSTSPSSLRTGSYVALGIGAAGVVTGIVFGAIALGKKSSLNAHCDGDACPASEQDDIDAMHSNAVGANVAFGVGVAGLVASVILYFVARGHADTAPATTARVRLAPTGAGVMGTFE